eukprot:scaffold141985_cov55-Attheya_sp.AAC.1
MEHPLGHHSRGTSRASRWSKIVWLERFNRIFGIFSKCSKMFTHGGILVCKKGTNIRTLHQLINKPSDKGRLVERPLENKCSCSED